MDYRTIYKNYYGIDFTNDYDVHHKDGDRSNNDIGNLLLLPKKLHHRYHLLKNIVDGQTIPTEITGTINGFPRSYTWRMMDAFVDCLCECNEWQTFKDILDGFPFTMPHIDTKGITNGGLQNSQD